MSISTLSKKGLKQVSAFMQKVIGETLYYSELARKEEVDGFRLSALTKKWKEGNTVFLVYRDGKSIAGVLSGYYDSGLFWVDWLVVDPQKRRLGVGMGLMTFLEQTLKTEGVHKLWCDSRTNNKESISLLKKLNFKKIATVKNHWYGQDFVLWQKFL